MQSEGNGEPTYYNSLYKHGVDEKRRLQIPAKWRPAKENFEFTLIVWPKSKEGPCLRALPPEQMAKTLGQTIIVNNKPGAATNIAADYVAKSKDIGHIMLTADFATLAYERGATTDPAPHVVTYASI